MRFALFGGTISIAHTILPKPSSTSTGTPTKDALFYCKLVNIWQSSVLSRTFPWHIYGDGGVWGDYPAAITDKNRIAYQRPALYLIKQISNRFIICLSQHVF